MALAPLHLWVAKRRRFWNPEIDLKSASCAFSNLFAPAGDFGWLHHQSAACAKSPDMANSNRQRRRRHAGHGCEQNGQTNPEGICKLTDSVVRRTVFLIGHEIHDHFSNKTQCQKRCSSLSLKA